MIDRVFVQMSGVPGSGKTTLAHALSQRIGAIVIDHDVTKSALLGAHVPVDLAGYASYMVLDALARHVLQQGYNVIFDSPCLYEELLARGQRLAHEMNAQYRYVECVVDDLDELDRRLHARSRLPSQLAGVRAAPTAGSGKAESGDHVFRQWIASTQRPEGAYLAIDTTRPLHTYLEDAVNYIHTTGSISRRAT